MNRPDKAGEPSMEEILASIRQIIADDPPSDRGGLVVEPNPLVPQSAAPPDTGHSPRSEGRTPLVDRLSDVLKSGPLPPTSPLGSKRPLSFDQDLADMFEEGDGEGPNPVPKPDLRVPFEPASAIKASAALPAAEELSAPIASSLASSSSAPSAPAAPSFGAPFMPQPAPAASTVPPMPFASASAPTPAAPSAPAPPKTFGFPPLRKQSFYPPQPKAAPELPPIPTKEPSVASESGTSGAGAGMDDDDGGLESAIARLSGLGAVVPGQMGASGPSGLNGSSSLNGASPLNGLGSLNGSESLNGSSSVKGAGTLNGSGAFGALGSAAKPSAAVPDPVLPDLSIAPDFASQVLEAEPVAEPTATLDAAPLGVRSSSLASEVSSGADAERATVAAQALDALAQGLAASAAASHASVSQAQPAIALTPVVPAEPGSAPRVQVLPGATVPPQATPQRSLEDAVADMLRPMLQQWVAENMPRIIEKALRVEVARSVKPDHTSKS